MEKLIEIAPNVLEKNIEKKYCFQVPTKVTKLDPIFIFNFHTLEFIDKKDICFDVRLNSNLLEHGKMETKKYRFDANGKCQIKHVVNKDYYIEGEIEYIIEPNVIDNSKTSKSCFVSITYGNNQESLHFIKGKFNIFEENTIL
ncbi:MAG: hypothetical protein JEZ09_04655 [Salinivirgaceae bacterium]|nr:hypothetical protein [Salinivirgaceae bacterium]